MKKGVLLLIGVFCLAVTSCGQSKIDYKNVGAAEFNSLIAGSPGIIVDIRTPGEYQEGHLKNALNIDFYSPDFKDKLNNIDHNKTVYVYCRSGNRSGKSLATFQELGFKNVVNLAQGIIDWKASGLPLE